MKRTAIITGITGQDGSYLAELLLDKDYQVVGVKRRNSGHHLGCSSHLEFLIDVEEADVTDLVSLSRITREVKPHEFYNLAAQSHVGTSFKQPVHTFDVNATGVINCLEAIKASGYHTRFYQASTSEIMGGVKDDGRPLDENSLFEPRSPYAVAKLAAYWAVKNYREAYRMHASNGILFNHESPRRGPNFVTRKITLAVNAIHAGFQKDLSLGNLDARRDWGHAQDYVSGMWLMLQQAEPDDYVLATGETRSVREFCQLAFSYLDLKYEDYVRVDPQFYRPTDVHVLCGDPSKATARLGWTTTFSFEELVADMMSADRYVPLKEVC